MKNLKDEYFCSLALGIDIIGGKWKLIILWYLIDGTKRFSEIKRHLPGVTQKMLTQQLRELEAHGIIIRTVYPIVPPKVEYTLSKEGERLIPIVQSLCDWSINYAQTQHIPIVSKDEAQKAIMP
ncbi:MAG: winged helix-turn-helix transcriptional regulator [Culicoidibacterales bacterium]